MRERRTYGERRTERKRHTGIGGKPFRRPRRIRARHDHRLMAILLWSFMAGTVRIVSENFGATLGSA